MLWWHRWRLKSKNTETRCWAAFKLGRSKNRRAISTLLAALTDAEASVRREVLEGLRRFPGDTLREQWALNLAMGDALLAAADDSDSDVRLRAIEVLGLCAAAAARALGEVGVVDGIESLVHALEDRSEEVQIEAVEALVKINHPSSTAALAKALTNGSVQVRIAAANELQNRKWQPADAIQDKWWSAACRESELEKAKYLVVEITSQSTSKKDREKASMQLAALGPIAAPALIEVASCGWVESAWPALIKIGEAAIEPIKILLEARPSDAQVEIIFSFLKKIGASPPVEQLLALSRRTDLPLSLLEHCIHQLGGTNDPRAVAQLIAYLRYVEQRFLRTAVVEALVRIGAAAIDDLAVVASDPQHRAQTDAALGLAALGDRRGVQFAINLLNDPDSDVRLSAASALLRCRTSESMAALVRMVSDTDYNVFWLAGSALAAAQDVQIVKPLLAKMSGQPVECADLLARLGQTIGVQTLLGMLHDDRFADRALQALSNILLPPFIERISFDDLHSIAASQSSYYLEYQTADGDFRRRTLDCTDVIRSAAEELERREKVPRES